MIILEINHENYRTKKIRFWSYGYIFGDVSFELTNSGQAEQYVKEQLVGSESYPCNLIYCDEEIPKTLASILHLETNKK